MVKIRFLLLSLMAAGTFMFSHVCLAAVDTAPAATFMQQLGDSALMYLSSGKIPETEKSERLRALFRSGFDTQTIGRFVLGRHWQEASEGQRREFLSLFEDMIVQTYQDRLTDDPLKSFKVLGATPAGESSQDAFVNSVIVGTSDPEPTKVTWRVRVKEGQMKIVDVLVNGISSSMTQRSDFDSVIMEGGGNIEALLASLRHFRRTTQ
jgi:phospholipid transport system substrate-binding protein